MKKIYQICTDSEAPRIRLPSASLPLSLGTIFDGAPKASTWPSTAPEAIVEGPTSNVFTFFDLAPGILVVKEELMELCEDFFWVARDGCEILPLRADGGWFNIIHPVDFLPPPKDKIKKGPPCLVDRYYSAIFRIGDNPSTNLYCVEGVAGAALNEFKGVYDHFGFRGIHFNPIWEEAG